MNPREKSGKRRTGILQFLLAAAAVAFAMFFAGCGIGTEPSGRQNASVTAAAVPASADTAGQPASSKTGSDQSGKTAAQAAAPAAENVEDTLSVSEDGTYTSKDEVALYLHRYGHLPENFITKAEARDLGWDSGRGNLQEAAPGKSIGGDRFGNYEGNLPEAEGRVYHECDIDYTGGTRNAKRIVYSNDGYIYYTDDHYNTFELLYEP